MDEIQNENQPLNLPVVALRDIVIYPRMSVNLDIGRKNPSKPCALQGKAKDTSLWPCRRIPAWKYPRKTTFTTSALSSK